jgi:hypothetical protein
MLFALLFNMKPIILLLIVVALGSQSAFAQTKTPAKKKATVKKPAVAKAKNDTVYSYYSNKKVSVKTAPWNNGNQQIWLYNIKGNVMYTFTNSRLHGSTHTDFKFRQDGSVSEAVTSMQPDGGIQHYTTYITFSNSNEPEWKHSEKYPASVTAFPDDYYWDKNTKSWKKQETIEEQPVPGK